MPVPAEGEVALISGRGWGGLQGNGWACCMGEEGEIRAPRASPTRTHAGAHPAPPRSCATGTMQRVCRGGGGATRGRVLTEGASALRFAQTNQKY